MLIAFGGLPETGKTTVAQMSCVCLLREPTHGRR
jgi:broad-specificity NMP kinase